MFHPFKVLFFFSAKLLRKDNNHRVSEEDSDILEAADWSGRGDHVRLQVPSRR